MNHPLYAPNFIKGQAQSLDFGRSTRDAHHMSKSVVYIIAVFISIFPISLLAVACLPPQPAQLAKLNHIHYHQDIRTGICFAFGEFNSNNAAASVEATPAFSYVPCQMVPAALLEP